MVTLLGAEGYELLEKYKLPVAPYSIVKNQQELDSVIRKFNLPVVLKAISQKIIHKTEAGAVKICKTKDEAKIAFKALQKLEGYVLVQKFIEGQMTIIGIKADPTFGQVIMFGLGGIMVEIFKDVSFRVCPITQSDARKMIKELKSYEILKGVRGQKPINFKLLEDVLVKTSQLAMKENIKELDMNPFIINGKQGFAVDVRIIR